MLDRMGLVDRDGNGVREIHGRPARFALLTQKGNTLRERAAAFLQEELRKIGLQADVVTLDAPAIVERITKGDYEAVYFGLQASDTDPAANLDFWLSSGAFHPWHPDQKTPASPWEARIDSLMAAQVAAIDPAERKRLFDEVQRVFAAEQPALFFAAPRVTVAMSARVATRGPALLQPLVLWRADDSTPRASVGPEAYSRPWDG